MTQTLGPPEHLHNRDTWAVPEMGGGVFYRAPHGTLGGQTQRRLAAQGWGADPVGV